MTFLKTLIIFCFLLLLQHLKAQTLNSEVAFTSYIDQKARDPNFINQNFYGGSDEFFTWQIADNGQVSALHPQYAHLKEFDGSTRYRGFISGVGSYIEANSDKFYLYNNRKLVPITELPSFRQNDMFATNSHKPLINPLPDDQDRVFEPWTTITKPSFDGSFIEWNRFLHCCLDQLVLTKDNIKGQKLQVTLSFVVGKDGVPYDIQATDIPSICPDCGEAAIKLLYKHLENKSSAQCNMKVTNKPYKQWLPGTLNGRYISSYIYLRIPFGYENDPQNKIFVNNTPREKPNSSEATEAPTINNENNSNNNDDDNLQEANVVEENGKYILTLLKDNSKHVVFRPVPKNGDSAMYNKFNKSITLNQGGWGEFTTEKNGNKTVKFYAFTGGDNKVAMDKMPFEYFEKMFYKPE